MKYLLLGLLLISIIVLAGCSQTVVKYQCNDGSFADSATLCASKISQASQDCPKLDCASCPTKTETKVEAKTIIEKAYVCPNGSESNEKKECFDTSVKSLSSSVRNDVTEFMGKEISHNLYIDGIFQNNLGKDIKNYQITGILYKNGQVVATSSTDMIASNMYLDNVNQTVRPGEKRAFSILFSNYVYYQKHEVLMTIG